MLKITRSPNVRFHVPAASKHEQEVVAAYIERRRRELSKRFVTGLRCACERKQPGDSGSPIAGGKER